MFILYRSLLKSSIFRNTLLHKLDILFWICGFLLDISFSAFEADIENSKNSNDGDNDSRSIKGLQNLIAHVERVLSSTYLF